MMRFHFFLRKHTRREKILKSMITATFLATLMLDAFIATHLAMAGNLIWLWVDFGDDGAVDPNQPELPMNMPEMAAE